MLIIALFISEHGYDLTIKEIDNPEIALAEFGTYIYDGIILMAPTAEGM